MCTKSPRLVFLISCSLLMLLGRTTSAQFSGLVKHIPGTANTIILLNAQKVLDSELAKAKGWQENFEQASEAGLVRLPADTQQYVLASQTDFNLMRPVWELGILKTRQPHSMVDVAENRRGRKDNIADQEVVLLPSGAYVVQFDHRTFGSLMPASRQAIARWIRSTHTGAEHLSKYIREAIGYSEQAGTEIIMAIDLADVIDSKVVHERLKEYESVSQPSIDVKNVARALTSIRGVTLGITLGQKPFGSIKLDFDNEVAVLDGIAGPLFVEVLKRNNALIDDFEQWDSEVKGKEVRFKGYLSEPGMRRVFSLIEAPVSEVVIAADTEAPQTGDRLTQEDIAYATQQYFRSLTKLMDEFRNHESPQRLAQVGLWLDKYARKIDRLPMVNVDKEMLDFGAYVAQQYRNAATAIKGIGIRSRVRSVNATSNSGHQYYGNNFYNGGYAYNGYYYHGGSGYNPYGTQNYAFNWNADRQAQQRAQTQIKVQEKTQGAAAARAIMQDVENATQQVRRQMVEKYGIDF